VYSPVSRV
jgi:hypothetical protein